MENKKINEINKIFTGGMRDFFSRNKNIEFFPWTHTIEIKNIKNIDYNFEFAICADQLINVIHNINPYGDMEFKVVANQQGIYAYLLFNKGILIKDKAMLRSNEDKRPSIKFNILMPITKKTIKEIDTLKSNARDLLSKIQTLYAKNITENSDFGEINSLNKKGFKLLKHNKIVFDNNELFFSNNMYKIILKTQCADKKIHSFSSEYTATEYDRLLNISNHANKNEIVTIFIMSDYYSSGGVEEYSKKLANLMLRTNMKRINWVSAGSNWNNKIYDIVDPRINQIHVTMKRNNVIGKIINLIKIKTQIRKVIKNNAGRLLILNPYFSYSLLSKGVVSKYSKVVSILHSSNLWITQYIAGNFIKRVLFANKVKFIDKIAAYPHHFDIECIDTKKMVSIIPFHQETVKTSSKKRNVVIFCSRVDYSNHKRVADFIELAKKSNILHIIAGIGQEQDVKKVINVAKNNENIEYFGSYNKRQLVELYNRAICQVMPSGVGEEGFPLSFVEAAKSGLPILIRKGASESLDILSKDFGDDWFIFEELKDVPLIIEKIKNNWDFYSKSILKFYNEYLSIEKTQKEWLKIIKEKD